MHALAHSIDAHVANRYLGLAPFLRASIAGEDLQAIANQILAGLDAQEPSAEGLMNLSIAVQCLGQKALGLSLQQQALALCQTYTLAARRQPAHFTLLLLVTDGTIQSHTPVECLLEDADVTVVFHYIDRHLTTATVDAALAALPAHDALLVAISDSDEHRGLLDALTAPLQRWSQPVLNAPAALHHTVRDTASALLSAVDGLCMPATARVSRAALLALADGLCPLDSLLSGACFPVIVRPLGSQGGAGLARIADGAALRTYLASQSDGAFFMAPFIDYSGSDGQFRKIRIALIDGQPYVSHMAISGHWMIHYVNAGMYEHAWKRQEEARFMREFDQFVQRHAAAFAGIARQMQLDYLVMDCAELPDGRLLVFEIDSGGVVHAMDLESVFPYKNGHIAKARLAFCQMLAARCGPDRALPAAPLTSVERHAESV